MISLIVSDMFESPTAHLADYILPVTTHLESNAITEYSGLNIVAARVRAMEPRGEAREEAEPVLEVLKRMGYEERMPLKTYRELLDYRLQPLGLTFDQFAEKGVITRDDEPLKYQIGQTAARRQARIQYGLGQDRVRLIRAVGERI